MQKQLMKKKTPNSLILTMQWSEDTAVLVTVGHVLSLKEKLFICLFLIN